MANYDSKQFAKITGTADDQFGKINDQTANYMNEQHQLAGGFGQEAKDIYGLGSGGLQGYTPEQQSQILGFDTLGGPGLSPEEVQQMAGNPGQIEANASQGVSDLQTGVNQGAVNIANLGQHNAGAIIGAVDPSKFNLSNDYTGAVSGALDQEGGALDSAVNNPNLGLSDQFNSDYNFGPADEQRVVTQAGTSIGNRYAATADQVNRAAAASGTTSPLALAASMNRLNHQSAADQGDAMTAAQIAAKNEALGVTQSKEQMRLGTAQDISSRQMQAGEVMGAARTGAANTGEQLRLSGQGQAQQLGLTAQEQAANQVMNSAQYGQTQQQQAEEYGLNTNISAQQASDKAATDRAAAIATNRQGANKTVTDRYKSIADTQQGAQKEYRDYVTAQEAQANQTYLTTQGQQTTAAAGQADATTKSETGAYNSGNQPGVLSKIAGGIGAAAGAAAKTIALADGGTVYGESQEDPAMEAPGATPYGGGQQLDMGPAAAARRGARYGKVFSGIEGAMGPGAAPQSGANGEAQQQGNINSLGAGAGALGAALYNSFAAGGTVHGLPSLPGGTAGYAPDPPPNATQGFRRYSPVGPMNPKIGLQPKPEEMAHHLPSRVRISPRMNVKLPRPTIKHGGGISIGGR